MNWMEADKIIMAPAPLLFVKGPRDTVPEHFYFYILYGVIHCAVCYHHDNYDDVA